MLPSATRPLSLGRYLLFDEVASGGMASVHFGRLSGPAGFSRVVAIKRLHPHYARDPEFVASFLEEARLAARIRHLNVVSTLDVVAAEDEVFLVMEYVHGQSLAKLWRAATRGEGKPIDPRIAATVMGGVLRGLHAAHEARSEHGRPLRIVHRDVSPQNVLVGTDGVARVLDFGVAKASGRQQTTQKGRIKGKVAYMPPEQLHGTTVTRRTDVYAAAVVTWELLTGRRAFHRDSDAAVVTAILSQALPPPSELVKGLPAGLDAVVMRAMSRNPVSRHATALQLAEELESCAGTAPLPEVAHWVEQHAKRDLEHRVRRMAQLERSSTGPDFDPAPARASDRPTVPAIPTTVDEPAATATVSRVALSSTMSRLRYTLQGRRIPLALIVAGGAVLVLASITTAARHLGKVSAAAPAVAVAPRRPAPAPARPPPVESATPAVEVGTTSYPSAPAAEAPAPPVGDVEAPVAPVAPPAPPRPAIKAKRDCNPPFTIDGNGYKVYKRACFT